MLTLDIKNLPRTLLIAPTVVAAALHVDITELPQLEVLEGLSAPLTIDDETRRYRLDDLEIWARTHPRQ